MDKHLRDLQKLWKPVSAAHEEARAFIYQVWPTFNTPGLKENLPKARQSFEECKRARDVIGIRKLFKGTEAHAIRLEKEARELDPKINVDDEKPARLLQEVNPLIILTRGQLSLYQWFELLRFDAVAADPVLGPRPDMGEEGTLARQGDGLEAYTLTLLTHLLGVETGQTQVAESLDQAAHDRRLAATGPVSRRFLVDGSRGIGSTHHASHGFHHWPGARVQPDSRGPTWGE